MIKRYSLVLLLLAQNSYAGLITHTDYTSGATITAAGQNANENTIVNEFNGNIDANNLATNAVTTIKITDANVTAAKLSTVLQSSITYHTGYANQRRPVLQFISVALVDVENNTATANETCIVWPDSEKRCVTENTGSSTKYRRFDITAAANWTSGTEDSGLISGLTEGINTWYAIYAIKSQINTANFVLAGSTNVPTAANVAFLNSTFGANAWRYLGLIRNGNNAGANSDIISFVQSGNLTSFTNLTTTATVTQSSGLVIAETAGASSLTYTYAAGTGNTNIPDTIGTARVQFAIAAGAGTASVSDSAGSIFYFLGSDVITYIATSFLPVTNGFKTLSSAASPAQDIWLAAFIDGSLDGSFGSL